MAIDGPVFGAFNQGVIPTIACFNQATAPIGVDLHNLVKAMQDYVSGYVAPVWGTPAALNVTKGLVPGHWAMVFLDDADQPGALAYHDLTPDGLPVAKVFVRTTIDQGHQVSVAASHELVEMLVDPAINLMTTGPNPKIMYAYESADPVEETSFDVNGIAMSNFVYPAYFETFRKTGSVQFDQMKKVQRPFQILPGGYQIIFNGGKYTKLFGSKAKAKRFAHEDRRGHRSEAREEGKLMRADRKAVERLARKFA